MLTKKDLVKIFAVIWVAEITMKWPVRRDRALGTLIAKLDKMVEDREKKDKPDEQE